MIHHSDFTKTKLRQLIQRGDITLGGNRRLKIYGLLTCSSGKRMKKENRVFFRNVEEARAAGFRACGRCLREP
jgi:hypothetical protein